MFTRPIMKTVDMAAHGELLKVTAELIDAGKIRSTLTQAMRKIDASTLKRVHALLETGKAHGKIVLEGF